MLDTFLILALGPLCVWLSFNYAKAYKPDEFGYTVNVITGILFAVVTVLCALGMTNTPAGDAASKLTLISAVISTFFSRKNVPKKEEADEKDKNQEP